MLFLDINTQSFNILNEPNMAIIMKVHTVLNH